MTRSRAERAQRAWWRKAGARRAAVWRRGLRAWWHRLGFHGEPPAKLGPPVSPSMMARQLDGLFKTLYPSLPIVWEPRLVDMLPKVERAAQRGWLP